MKFRKWFIHAVPLLVFAVVVFLLYKDNSRPTEKTNSTNISIASPTPPTMKQPQMEIEKNKSYSAVIKTSVGDITIELFASKTPVTVNNFVSLANKSFYDGTVFHRTIKGFMIQGGDPNGDGTGGPGYEFDDEPFDGSYDRGVVAMANRGANTNGSQFFIMHETYPLAKDYVIFGKVVKGMEVVDKIATAPTTSGADGQQSKPVNPVKVEKVDIVD